MKSSTFSTLLAFLGFAAFAQAGPLGVGDPAPEVSGPNQDGQTVHFKDIYAKGLTLVYFYPKADTPGCTKEACSIRDSWGDLQKNGVQVIGVSGDKPEAQKQFAEKYRLPHTLIADFAGSVAKAFGVPTLLGISKRQSFLIANGKCVWNQTSASTDKQAEDVLKAVASLPKN